MSHFFKYFPTISYDLLKNGNTRVIQNPLVRFKILNALKNRTALYYTYDIKEGQSAQFIAHKYYGDETLDWILFLTNDIIDPLYDWPLDYQDFTNYLKNKYGSIETALNTFHSYEWIYQSQQTLYDGTIVSEKVLNVDAETYAGLPVNEKREVSKYDYEQRLNDKKRNIKILKSDYLGNVLTEIERVFR